MSQVGWAVNLMERLSHHLNGTVPKIGEGSLNSMKSSRGMGWRCEKETLNKHVLITHNVADTILDAGIHGGKWEQSYNILGLLSKNGGIHTHIPLEFKMIFFKKWSNFLLKCWCPLGKLNPRNLKSRNISVLPNL